MPKELSAGAVVFKKEDNKIHYLILHYKSGHWDFPKGHIEKGETEKETVIREIKEETGIEDAKIIGDFRNSVKYFFRKTYGFKKEDKQKAPRIFKTVIFYLAETGEKDIKISSEHKGYKWLEYQEALKRLTFKNAKEILKKANEIIILPLPSQ